MRNCLGLARTIYIYIYIYTVYVRYFWQENHQIGIRSCTVYMYGSGQLYKCLVQSKSVDYKRDACIIKNVLDTQFSA